MRTHKWKALTGYLKDPVANYASLPAAGNSSGDVRKTLDNQRHFTWNGASWVALAVDQNGNFTVPGALTVNGSKVVGDGGTNTWIQQSGKLNVTDSAGAYTDLQANDFTATGRTTTNDLLVSLTVTSGTACSPNGLVAKDSTGLLLSCQSGVWSKAQGSGSSGTYVSVGSYAGTYNGFNNNDSQVLITARGGGGCNRFDLTGSVTGFGVVVNNYTANPDWSKSSFISFMVPAKTGYTITAYPYQCGSAGFAVVAYIF